MGVLTYMHCCLLQKLRIRFVTKRNQRKRQRDEVQEKVGDQKVQGKVGDQKSPSKRLKTNELPVKDQSMESGILSVAHPDSDKTEAEEHRSVDHMDEIKMEDETDGDEDPEEDPEEYEEMEESSTQLDSSNVSNKKEVKTDVNAEPEKVAGVEKDAAEQSFKEKLIDDKVKPKSDGDICEKRDAKLDCREGETCAVMEVAVDKELLQACFLNFLLP